MLLLFVFISEVQSMHNYCGIAFECLILRWKCSSSIRSGITDCRECTICDLHQTYFHIKQC
ncbi:hypothetical protein RchiOBHm_Chr3g0497231 [Rosa chinensis]|uniref:Uncharacterized protein n=1 Tax=Rosa chinensis TaxID=74649 RepID=A0A2P6RHP0_ROSCH|nr:hypothetical protein RchiOBHm_Chr3g0497231 [Rosa chinensis]